MYSTLTNLKLINLKTKKLETYSYPTVPVYVVDNLWIGKNLLIHYFSNDTMTGLIKLPSRTDHYYFFSPESGKFTPIAVDETTSKYTAHNTSVIHYIKKTDSDKAFAIAYCIKEAFFGDIGCTNSGFSISDGLTIKRIINLDIDIAYSPAYEWGWSGDNFFVKQKDKVYLVDMGKLF